MESKNKAKNNEINYKLELWQNHIKIAVIPDSFYERIKNDKDKENILLFCIILQHLFLKNKEVTTEDIIEELGWDTCKFERIRKKLAFYGVFSKNSKDTAN
jgi:hypothetical protein